MASSQELKELGTTMDDASRPYGDAEGKARALRGRVGLGRSQQQSAPASAPQGGTNPGPPMQPPAPQPSTDRAALDPGTEDGGAPRWPLDITTRQQHQRTLDEQYPDLVAPGTPLARAYQRGGSQQDLGEIPAPDRTTPRPEALNEGLRRTEPTPPRTGLDAVLHTRMPWDSPAVKRIGQQVLKGLSPGPDDPVIQAIAKATSFRFGLPVSDADVQQNAHTLSLLVGMAGPGGEEKGALSAADIVRKSTESVALRLRSIGLEQDAQAAETATRDLLGDYQTQGMTVVNKHGSVIGRFGSVKEAQGYATRLNAAADVRAGRLSAEEFARQHPEADTVPGKAPPQGSATAEPRPSDKALQVPDQTRTPFEGTPRREQAGVTAAEARSPELRYPTEENLGVPKNLMESLPQNLRDMVVEEARSDYAGVTAARGGVVNQAQVEKESEQILIDAGVLAQTAPRTPVTAPGMRALARAVRRVTQEREAIEAEAVSRGSLGMTDELRARFAVKVFEQNSLQRVIAGARAEWGRVGQAMQEAVASGDKVRLNNTYRQVLRAVGKNNVDRVLDRLSAIRSDPNLLGDPYRREVAAMKFVQGLSTASNWDKLDEAFYNAVLSIPHTHVGIVLGQELFAEAEVLSSLLGSGVGAIAHYGTFGRLPRGKTFSQALVEAVADKVGAAQGLGAAKVYLRTGVKRDELSTFLGTGGFRRGHALEGSSGAILNAPTRLIDTYTVAFHERGYTRSIWGQAMQKAIDENGGSIFNQAVRDRAQELISSPTAEMQDIANKAGRRASVRGTPDSALNSFLRDLRDMEIPGSTPVVGKVLGGFAPGRRVIPFVNIMFNLTGMGVEYSPLGFFNAMRQGRSAEQRYESIARAGLGSLLYYHLWQKAQGGELSGPAPDNLDEAALWRREGKQPFSYKVGNDWVPFDRILGPLAFPARTVTGIEQAVKDAQGKPLDAALVAVTAMKAVTAMGQAFADSTFMIGPDQILQAGKAVTSGMSAGDPQKALGGVTNYAGEQVASQIPFSNFLRSWAQSTDPYVRRVQGFLPQIEAIIPGLSALLPASQDVYGQDVKRPPSQQGVAGVVSPIRSTTERLDPVDQELMKHSTKALVDGNGQKIPPHELFVRKAQADIGTFKLTGEEGALLQTLAGRSVYQALSTLFGSDAYKAMSEDDKVKAIQKAVRDGHKSARIATSDAILQNATTAPEVARAVDMHLSVTPSRHDRALYLAGLAAQGKLSAQATALINEKLATKSGEPTVAEYLRAAPLVRDFLAEPMFDRLSTTEAQQLKAERAEHARLAARDRVDGTRTADEYAKAHPMVLQSHPRSQARQRILDRNPWLAPYVAGLTYEQSGGSE